jgi:hypothetical protein
VRRQDAARTSNAAHGRHRAASPTGVGTPQRVYQISESLFWIVIRITPVLGLPRASGVRQPAGSRAKLSGAAQGGVSRSSKGNLPYIHTKAK